MRKHPTLHMLGTGLFALPILVLGLTFWTLASTVEARSCPPCDMVELNCVGSTCVCTWSSGGGGYNCHPE